MYPPIRRSSAGWIEVVCGCMFAGKTEELIRRLKRAFIGKQEVICFKPAKDDRYAEEEIVTHEGDRLACVRVAQPQEITAYVDGMEIFPDVVGIDEVQFFSDDLVGVVEDLANRGVRVICAGLDLDYLARPFGPIPALLAAAEYPTKVHAVCVQCGDPANRSYRKTDEKGQVLVGAKDHYEPRCRRCFVEGMEKRN